MHDAICYMRSEADLLAAIRTSYEHLREGGVALFVPDCVRESFFEHTDEHGADAADGSRGLRAVEWMWDPDPNDTTYVVDYAFLLRDASGVRAVHDRHVEGLFAIDTWRSLIEGVGFRCSTVTRSMAADGARSPYAETMFLAVR